MSLPTGCDTVRPGSRVLIAAAIEAYVASNQIRAHADGTLYVASLLVQWWDGRARHEEWVEPWEVSPIEPAKPMGFSADG